MGAESSECCALLLPPQERRYEWSPVWVTDPAGLGGCGRFAWAAGGDGLRGLL